MQYHKIDSVIVHAMATPVKEEEEYELCPDCFNSPCFLVQGLHGSILQHYEEDLCDDLEGLPMYNNKAIRHRLYIRSVHWIHGPTGKGNRKKLPECVVQVIRDIAPADPGTNYIGFKDSIDNPQEDHSVNLKTSNNDSKENVSPVHENCDKMPENNQQTKRRRLSK